MALPVPKSFKSPALPCFLVFLLVAAAVISAFWKTTDPALYYYDEADYMYAATRGFFSNYLDRPSLSTADFVRRGIQLARDRTQRTNMSEFIRSSGDITFYRHYHGPVYAYWISLWQALGAESPKTFRASGLLIHLGAATLIFWMFRMVFAGYPAVAALAAALAFLMNRTALVSATVVTQHVMFTLLAGLTLFLMARFCRGLDRRYWYAAAAVLGLAFSTVETSFVLLAAILPVLLLVAYPLGWKQLLGLLLRGAGVFLAAILMVWPKGILQLGVLKGYLYLAYMAVSRKAFSPISPRELWAFKFRVYPLEFVIPALALIACTIWWRRLQHRREALPFLVYAWMFTAVTMVVTIPYTHYYGSLLLAGVVLTGVAFAELWMRRNLAIRALASLALVATLTGMNVLHYRERDQPPQHDYRADMLAYLARDPDSPTVYVPFVLVPTIHFYRPQSVTVGYDTNWSGTALADALSQAGPNAELLCVQPVCDSVRGRLPQLRQTQVTAGGVPVYGQATDLEILYSLRPQ